MRETGEPRVERGNIGKREQVMVERSDEGCERVGEDDDEEGSVSDEKRERISNSARQGRVDGQSHSRRIVWPIRCRTPRSWKTHRFQFFAAPQAVEMAGGIEHTSQDGNTLGCTTTVELCGIRRLTRGQARRTGRQRGRRLGKGDIKINSKKKALLESVKLQIEHLKGENQESRKKGEKKQPRESPPEDWKVGGKIR